MKNNVFSKVTFFVMGVMMCACSGSDDTIEDITPQQPGTPTTGKVILRGTLSGGITRSQISDAGVATWSNGDKIAVRYQKTDGSYAKADATVSAGGNTSATFSAELDSPKAGSVQMIYPANLYQETSPYYNTTTLMTNQKGTLADIGQNWNIQTATTTMSISANEATLSAVVQMKSQISLCVFTLKKDADNTLSATKLDISDGTNNYIIQPASASTSYAVAMLPTNNANFTFLAKTTEVGRVYDKQKNVTLSNCTTSNIGDVVDKDGNIYSVGSGSGVLFSKSFSNVTLEKAMIYNQDLILLEGPNFTPIAMIAYVGAAGTADKSEGSGDYRGLAMAMQNVNNSEYSWGGYGYAYQACTFRSAYYTGGEEYNKPNHRGNDDNMKGIYFTDILSIGSCPFQHTDHIAAIQAKSYSVPRPLGCSNWFLPTSAQWALFIEACGIDTSTWWLNYSYGNTEAYNKTAGLMKNAGIDLNVRRMWTSSEQNDGNAVHIYLREDGIGFYGMSKTTSYGVRPFFAFN